MENLTGGTPPVRYLPCVVPCKLYFMPIQINGLIGHRLIYRKPEGSGGCYEVQFDLSETRKMVFLVDALRDKIENVVVSSEFRTALDGMRAE